jgi:signal transduction histidine kinase
MPAPPCDPRAGLKTILVIDDEDSVRLVLTRGLENAGYRVLAASDANTGFDLARTHLPDLVLCDVNMPGKSGHRLLQEMRADALMADRPFVLMTGNAALARTRDAMDLGADDFLPKPFTVSEVVSCVNARLQRAAVSRRVEDRAIEELRTTLRSTLPHEFFTPLAGVLGLTDLLESDLDTLDREEMRKSLQDIRRCCRRLHRTLRNYLLILELDPAGERAPCGLLQTALVEQAVTNGAQAAAERHDRAADLKLNLHPAPLRASPTEISAMVEELVDNAFAFSRPGTPVHLHAWPDGPQFRLTVTDSGRGLTPQQLQQLGTFQQPDRRRFEQQGLGLGLALVRRFATYLGGGFHLASEAGRGTTAHVVLPAGMD